MGGREAIGGGWVVECTAADAKSGAELREWKVAEPAGGVVVMGE